MHDEPHTQKAASPRWQRSLTVLAAVSVVLTACGSQNPQAAADPSLAAGDAIGGGDVQYGASLDEWAEAADGGAEPGSTRQIANGPPGEYEEVSWEDLLPAGYSADEIRDRYAFRLAALDDGSPEANAIYAEMQAEYLANSGEINDELNGTKVNLAGFVAPLNNNGDLITEFLLVPYFGACIHVPAPPPNQTVLVKVDEANGLTFEESWGPVWVAGTLTVDPATTDLATASYTMTNATSGVYDEYG